MTVKAKPRVLCVDDEPMILSALKRQLGARYDVTVAEGGQQGLACIRAEPAFAVITSDLRMPGMDGVAFLAEARALNPDSVRVLLTGQADLDAAVEAVNEGSIFRFLRKPCPPPALLKALQASVEQYELVTAERVLLEQTLHGSIKTLTDLLGIVSPEAFGRAARVKEGVGKIAGYLQVENQWQVEIAAMVSQMGSVTLPAETAERMYYGTELSPQEAEMVARVPEVTAQLLANIPRLETVVRIVENQNGRFDLTDQPAEGVRRPPPLGARILKALTDFDVLVSKGTTGVEALNALKQRSGVYDPDVLTALAEVYGEGSQIDQVIEVKSDRLTPGMVFADDVRTVAGVLLVARGFEVTRGVVERLRNFEVAEPVRVLAAPAGEDADASTASPELANIG